MKKISLLIITLFFLFAACFKPEIAPPLDYQGKANMTIAEFQKLRTLGTEQSTYIDTIAIISGIVTSTDQFGSCYKEIFLQDSTGGISIRTSNTSYYTKYPVGQRIFVKAKGLYLGNYVSGNNYGFYRIGQYGGDGGAQDLSLTDENKHVFRSGVPGKRPAPKIITQASDINTNVGGDYHTLVKLVNCRFANAKDGNKYYEEKFVLGGAANQPIILSSGTGQVIARISSPVYCSFANDTMPEGALNITGILTRFGGDNNPTNQFIICSINDVEVIPPAEILKKYDMTTDPFSQGWTNKQVIGETVWTYYLSDKNVRIRPQTGNDTECWLVSPKFNFSGKKNITLTFNYRLTDGTSENAQVLYTVDGKTWNLLDFIPKISTTDATILLDNQMATNPNLQIAFKYKTTNLYPMWVLNSIVFESKPN